jgi:hypothetical protein
MARSWLGALALAALSGGCSADHRISGPVGVGSAAGTIGSASGLGGASGIAGRGAIDASGAGGTMPVDGGGAVSCATGLAGTMSPDAGRGGPPSITPVTLGATTHQAVPPPAVSGGTLRVLAGGQTAVASDPDRDKVYVVDLPGRALRATIALAAGDEPGRVIQDGAGRVHVALRRGGAIATIDAAAGTLTGRRDVCAAPRGLAYDPVGDLVHVACADGTLVSLPAAGGDPVRTLTLDGDLRDVVVDGTRLRVSRFKSAELLTVEADGTVSARAVPPDFAAAQVHLDARFTPSVAWQTMAAPDGTVVMLHQRGDSTSVSTVGGGYGGVNPCDAIVHPAVTTFAPDGTIATGPALAGMVLVVDMAISADGSHVAFVSLGNATNRQSGATAPQLTRVFATSMAVASDPSIGCNPDGVHGPCPGPVGRPMPTPPPPVPSDVDGGAGGVDGGAGGRAGTAIDAGVPDGAGDRGSLPSSTCGVPDPSVPNVVGEPIAVAYAGDGSLVVQSREPAMLAFADGTSVSLATDSRADTGHAVFHANAGGFVACASCHPEGREDGRVWNFACGARRTQSLQTGLRGTEPFHWSGDEADFSHLMSDVFVGRMSGPVLPSDQADALLTWLDAQPRPPQSAPADPAAVERGRLLFDDTQHVGCVTCHAGSHFTTSATVDVGTGGAFQIPSLVGVGTRAPFMHNGCAATLRDRFSPACGGTNHGLTSQLSEAQISDLVAYLGTI